MDDSTRRTFMDWLKESKTEEDVRKVITSILWHSSFARTYDPYLMTVKKLSNIPVADVAFAFVDLAVRECRNRCVDEFGFDPGDFNPTISEEWLQHGEAERIKRKRGRKPSSRTHSDQAELVEAYRFIKLANPERPDELVAGDLNVSPSSLYRAKRRVEKIELMTNS